LTTIAYATLSPALRADGAAFATLLRNMGSSAGVAIVEVLYTRDSQVAHSRLVEHVRPDNPMFHAYLRPPYDFVSTRGLTLLDGEVDRQASMLGYVQVFHLMFLVSVIFFPVTLLLRKPGRTGLLTEATPAVIAD
jgi:DHA2 family multidrug resistance protein